jgi:ligand-binding sensor domain-containing protein/signal transduction histidine kinase
MARLGKHTRPGVWLGVCWLCLLTTTAGQAADYLTRLWQTEQGLPQNTITALAQTRDGYLWIGTQQGLARFDGATFVVFNSAQIPAFKSDHISALLAEAEDGLWIGTAGGGVTHCRGRQFENWSVLNGLSSDMVTSLAAGTEGDLWVGTVYGLNRLQAGRVTTYTSAEGLPGVGVLALATDGQGRLWVATEEGLAVFAQGKFQLVESLGVRTEQLMVDREGDLWAGSRSFGLWHAQQGHSALEQVPALSQVTAVGRSASGAVWVGLGTEGVQLVQAGKTNAVECPALESPVTCLYEDRESNLWVGTDGGGLLRLTPRQLVTFTRKDGLPGDTLNALMEDGTGRLWVGSQSGEVLVYETNHFARVQLTERAVRSAPVLALCGGADGAVWLGTRGNGPLRYQQGNLTVPLLGDSPLPAVVTALFVDREAGLWMGTEAEGVIYRRERTTRRYSTSNGLSRNEAICIAQTPDAAVWLGTRGGGLNRIWTNEVSTFGRPEGLASEAIRALHVDKEGDLWVGTSAGLSLYQEGRFFTYTRRHGLVDDLISQIVSDDWGRLWLGCNRGLLRVARRELLEVAAGQRAWLTCVPFGTQDGMVNPECLGGRQSAALKDHAGRLWFATERGLVRVEPSPPTAAPRLPTVLVERAWLNEEEVVSDPVTGRGEPVRQERVRVPPGNAKLELQYTATTLRAPEKTRFRYRLEGFDPEWVNAGENRRALYSRLAPGEYRFRVVACNEEGEWNLEGASLGVVVLPHFWQTALFKVVVGMTAVGAVGGMLWLRRARQKGLERLRLRIAGDLHDDLGSNLSSIALLSRRIRRHTALPGAARGELEEIEQIAQQTTRAIRDIIWFIQPDRDTLGELVRRMQEVATLMLAEVDCAFTVADLPASGRISPEFRRNVFLVFKETIHNIVRHAQCSRVEIQVGVAGESLSVMVRDNGRGFSLNLPASGNGLKQMQLRMARLGGQCVVQSEPGQGTKVELRARVR